MCVCEMVETPQGAFGRKIGDSQLKFKPKEVILMMTLHLEQQLRLDSIHCLEAHSGCSKSLVELLSIMRILW